MQLTITTDYAVRTLLYLGLANRRSSSAEIAEAMGIPGNYLPNIARILRKHGFIETRAGSGGGYVLAKNPKDISLLDIIKAMEGTVKVNECLEEEQYCSRGAADDCPVRETYLDVQEVLERALSSVSLKCLIEEQQKKT